jgi:hypothetical protein
MTEVRKKTRLRFLDDGAVALAGAVLGLNLAVATPRLPTFG